MKVKNKSIYCGIFLVLIFLGLAGCDPYTSFGCVAPESHPAVEHARSLSPNQLQIVYSEIDKLSLTYVPENYETQINQENIPESLHFLEAELIWVYRDRGAYIILANCFDERIELTLSAINDPNATSTLRWAEPTNKNSYAMGSEILLQVDKGE